VLGGDFQPICNNTPFAGTTFTVYCVIFNSLGSKCRSKIHLIGQHLGREERAPGECAVTGELIMGLAWDSGLRAFVTDTHIRDCDGLEPFNIAFFAKGLNPDEVCKSGLGKIGCRLLVTATSSNPVIPTMVMRSMSQ
jgi:regulator of RNase E activity RraA